MCIKMDITHIENVFIGKKTKVTERVLDVTNLPLHALNEYCVISGNRIEINGEKILMPLVTIEELI